jgi:hypothetical protein
MFQHVEQPRVKRYAFGLQQAFIRRVAHQGVLEEVGRIRRRATTENQFSRQESLQCISQLAFRKSCQFDDRRVIESAADDSGGLRHLLHAMKSVKARHKRVMQRGWDGKRAQGAVELIGVRSFTQRARLDDSLGHFLDEERHTVGFGGDLVQQRVGQALPMGDARDNRLCGCARKTVQREARDHRMASEAGDKGRPCGDEEKNARTLYAVQRQLDQLQCGRIDPVRVFDQPEYGLPAGEPRELVDQSG